MKFLKFAPHNFEPRCELIEGRIPKILLSPRAFLDMFYISEACEDEVSWLGTVRELGESSYLIEEVFLFKQEVTGVSTEIDQDDLGRFFNDLLAQPNGQEKAASILFWGHVHPGSFTSPSGVDEAQMRVFSHSPWFIMGIFTRSGRAEFTFFDYSRGVRFSDCPWEIYLPEDASRKARIVKEVKAKVKRVVPYDPYDFGASKKRMGGL